MINKNFKRILIFVISLLFTYSASGEEGNLSNKKDLKSVISDLEINIPKLMKAGRIPGLQIALIRDGRTVWEKGFGVKNTKNNEAVDENTIFEAASLTKPLFAYMVMMLVEKGKINLDKPIVKYIPRKTIEKEIGHSIDVPGFRKDWLEMITARQVLSHSSGLPHGEGGKVFPILFKPGTKWKYSASGYFFLQLAIEDMLGEKLEIIMKKYVLDPLGMKDSWLVWKDEYDKTSANGHDFYGKPENFRKRKRAYSSATLYTTAGEYAKFVCAILNKRRLKQESFKAMLDSQVDMNKEKGMGWGLGFGTQTDKNGSGFWQWGDYGVFRNYILAYPEQKTGVVYLTNSFYGLSIAGDITGISLGSEATGAEVLKYDRYDSPFYRFAWAIVEKGSAEVEKLYPEMKKKYPHKLPEERMVALAGLLSDTGKDDVAIALFKMLVKEKPGSAEGYRRLGRSYLEQGDLQNAGINYEKALKLLKKSDPCSDSLKWDMAYIKALESPIKLDEESLKTLAGDYGARHFRVKEGKLFYFRDNVSEKNYRELIPMSKDTFIIKKMIYFRLRFKFASDGKADRVIGMYEEGRTDQSLKDK